MEVSQIYRQTTVKSLFAMMLLYSLLSDLLEVELASRAQEDEEERRKQKSANTAIASASFTQKGNGKGKPKPICRDFVTDTGCPKRGSVSLPTPQHCRSMSQMRVNKTCSR